MRADDVHTPSIRVRIGPSDPRFLVDARKGRADALEARLADLCRRSGAALVRVAPGRWQVIFGPAAAESAGSVHAATGPDGAVFDVTGGFMTARVEGAAAAAALSRAMRIDVTRLAVGQGTQVEAHGTSVQVFRISDDSYAVTAPRSAAAGLFASLFPTAAA
ncbi:hypothetical protein [Chthonobacter albigriseus]|uniref:hypothetical protein n=1 Tax=Chthonobacter albigriseus TaxID=1683161 RepID=UPI0015EE41FA|nr:hypothetical protein [Chthonobacter albigriseus]